MIDCSNNRSRRSNKVSSVVRRYDLQFDSNDCVLNLALVWLTLDSYVSIVVFAVAALMVIKMTMLSSMMNHSCVDVSSFWPSNSPVHCPYSNHFPNRMNRTNRNWTMMMMNWNYWNCPMQNRYFLSNWHATPHRPVPVAFPVENREFEKLIRLWVKCHIPSVRATIFSTVSDDREPFCATQSGNSFCYRNSGWRQSYRPYWVRRATSRQARIPFHPVFVEFPTEKDSRKFIEMNGIHKIKHSQLTGWYSLGQSGRLVFG